MQGEPVGGPLPIAIPVATAAVPVAKPDEPGPVAKPDEPGPSTERFIRSMPTASARDVGKVLTTCVVRCLQVGPGRQCSPSACSEVLVKKKRSALGSSTTKSELELSNIKTKTDH